MVRSEDGNDGTFSSLSEILGQPTIKEEIEELSLPEDRQIYEQRTAQDVAGALDWQRRKMNKHGKGLLVVAFGENAVSFAKDVKLTPRHAVQMLLDNVDQIERGLERLEAEKVTRGFTVRERGINEK